MPEPEHIPVLHSVVAPTESSSSSIVACPQFTPHSIQGSQDDVQLGVGGRNVYPAIPAVRP